MCLCTQPYARTKPTPRAIKLGTLLYAIMIILLGLMIAGFIGGYYQLGILAIFLIVTGWLGVKDKNCYNIEQILCVTFFSGYIWVYTSVDLILKLFANGEDVPIPVLVSLIGGVVFYLLSCIIAKMLYDELRSNYNQVMDGGGANLFGRMMGGQQAQAQRVPDNEPLSAEEVPFARGGNIPPNRADDRGRPLGGGNARASGGGRQKFDAFQGQAHSLDDV